jgi:solute carrier family 25 (mitochondrial citrate transporter), member 1
MQSIMARRDYGNSFKCAWMIYKQEGVFAFWAGATPRLARLLLSGGIVFTVYDLLWELLLIPQIRESHRTL